MEKGEPPLVIAQCQRCGRGFITVPPHDGVWRDHYGYPKRKRGSGYPDCNGFIRMLAEPVPVTVFNSYGHILPPKAREPA